VTYPEKVDGLIMMGDLPRKIMMENGRVVMGDLPRKNIGIIVMGDLPKKMMVLL